MTPMFPSSTFSRDFVPIDDADVPGANVFRGFWTVRERWRV